MNHLGNFYSTVGSLRHSTSTRWQDVLGAASIASLFDFFAKLAIASLNLLKRLFGCLGCSHITSSEGD